MQDLNLQLVDLAQKNRLLTRKQAELIRQELSEDPKANAGKLMLRRLYLTEDQLKELMTQVGMPEAHLTTSSDSAPVPDDMGGGETGDEYQGGDSAAMDQAATAQQRRAAEPQEYAEPEQAVQPPAQPAQPAAPRSPKTLVGLLKLARHWGCSDLHISVGRPPFVRLNGELRYMEMDPLTPDRAMDLNFSVLTEEQRLQAQEAQQLDFAIEVANQGRYRCSVFKQRLGWDGAYRIVASRIPTVEELGLPESLKILTEYNQGLVMVSGPGGSGKTTTVAALVQLVNLHRKDHIITVEDPIEYVFQPASCQIIQREVGRHTVSFAAALRAAMREDPDILLIGEMRDLEATSIAITAAETGHLVFGTMHTGSATRTVSRIVDLYPLTQQAQVRTMVAESLRGVITQQLIPRKDGNGRVLALEIMMSTSGISQQIKEGKTHLLRSLIQGGKRQGMVLMEDSLMALYNQGLISGRTAWQSAMHKQNFEPFKDQT